MTEDADLQPWVAEQYRRLADALDTVGPEAWEQPSLCAGWRVREVVAHVSMASRYGPEEFMAKLRAYGFDFGRLSDDLAAQDAELPVETLLANLRSDVLGAWAPPGGGYRGALNHAVVHGLDAVIPLGVHDLVEPETLRSVLDDLTAGGTHENFGVDLRGRRLVATDLDWSYGDGDPLEGPAELLVSALGRRDLGARLVGAPLTPAASDR